MLRYMALTIQKKSEKNKPKYVWPLIKEAVADYSGPKSIGPWSEHHIKNGIGPWLPFKGTAIRKFVMHERLYDGKYDGVN